MVEPQPSKRLRIDLIEKTNPQVSALISARVYLNHRLKSISCPIRAQSDAPIPSIPDGNRSASAQTFNLMP
jgi:hypothetical protein